jgi:hypothetical protein
MEILSVMWSITRLAWAADCFRLNVLVRGLRGRPARRPAGFRAPRPVAFQLDAGA